MSNFKDVKFMTAKEKELVLRAWQRFLANGLRDQDFTQALYSHLIQHCSFIAHYDRAGFYEHYFADPEMTTRFFSQFDGNGPCLSVEYGMDYWIRNGNDVCQEYYDINQEMVRVATAFIDGITLKMTATARDRDLAHAKRLLAKWEAQP